MIIKLNWLRIENFKGIKNLLIKFDGKDTDIYGNNATYKTSIEDAWRWLLFNKNSEDREDTSFDIKPQDKDGNDIMGTETLVEAELIVDNKPMRLKKTRVEKWTKKTNTFNGHERKYWFDEKPGGATMYKNGLNKLLTEDVFKMITNPFYFNSQMHWKKRLEILYEIYVKESDEEIIEANSKISRLTEILNGKDIESYEAIIKDKLKGLREEKDDIPSRIDEITLSLPETEPDYTVLEAVLSEKKILLAKAESKLTDVALKAEELSKLHKELFALRGKLEETKLQIKSQINTGRTELIEKQGELLEGRMVLEQSIQTLKSQIQSLQQQIKTAEEILVELREEWAALNAEKADIAALEFVEADITTHCPVCKQPLPEETIEDKKAEMKEGFEKSRERQLESIIKRIASNKGTGISTKGKAEQNKAEMKEYQAELSEKQVALEKIETELSELAAKLNEPLAEPDYTEHAGYNELAAAIEKLQAEINKPAEDETGELLIEKASLQAEIDELNKTLNSKGEIEKKKERIEFLKTEERRISNLIAELNGHNFLIDEFYLIKTEMVNKNFEHVRFRFFEKNDTNDNREKMCEAEINTNGSYVKYLDANTAGQVNAGLDIINVLCDFHGVIAPIFIDNAERVTDFAKTNSQVIKLIKPEIPEKREQLQGETDKDYQKFLSEREALLKKYNKLVVEVR